MRGVTVRTVAVLAVVALGIACEGRAQAQFTISVNSSARSRAPIRYSVNGRSYTLGGSGLLVPWRREHSSVRGQARICWHNGRAVRCGMFSTSPYHYRFRVRHGKLELGAWGE